MIQLGIGPGRDPIDRCRFSDNIMLEPEDETRLRVNPVN
jgi:hypothetical protein